VRSHLARMSAPIFTTGLVARDGRQRVPGVRQLAFELLAHHVRCATAAMPRVEPSGAHDGDRSTSAAMHRVTAPLPLAPLDAVLLVAGAFPTSPRIGRCNREIVLHIYTTELDEA